MWRTKFIQEIYLEETECRKDIQKPMGRDISLDIAKGVLILLVVIGHGFQYAFGSNYGQSGLFFINPIYRAIYMFHMPLFMFISGYFFLL